ncbi:beta-eliminating lyase-related protein [Dermatophilaceae bacterium Sec6.4]
MNNAANSAHTATAPPRFLNGDGAASAADLLSTIPPDTTPDVYGNGGVVQELEQYTAGLLGKQAAVFFPSGIMGQGAALTVLAARHRSSTVAWHPLAHPQLHELDTIQRVHRLNTRLVGDRSRLLRLLDLQAIPEQLAVLLLELPQRELGGQLPAWVELEEQVGWAREHDVSLHLDGARLWEAAAGYGCEPDAIAALFDTVYVSFYKGIGALSGCCVAGDTDVADELREWRRRLGGTLYGLWPLAASALKMLPERLPEMPERLDHGRAIANALRRVAGVTVVPELPHTPMMHLLLQADQNTVEENAARILERDGLQTFRTTQPTIDPNVVKVELTVGRATMQMTPEEVAAVIRELIS